MNSHLLQMLRGEKLIEPLPFKNLFILKRHTNIKSDQPQIKLQSVKSSILKSERSVKIHSRFYNMNSLSCLISKPKKSHSIGYKQYKQQSKRESLLRFQFTQKESQRYQSRQVQKESRKSMLSGKKFSVEPTSKYRTESRNSVFRSSILHSERLNTSEINAKMFFKNELKSIVREVKEEQHNFCVRGLPSCTDLPRQNSNLSKFIPQDNGLKAQLKVGYFQNKPYYILNKKKIDKIGGKIKYNEADMKAKSKGSFIAASTQDKQSDSDLCGWSSRSFYPNSSLLSFKNSRVKTDICKENIE